MKTMLATALTVCCWGIYGPVLHVGQHEMGDKLRPFICVGLAYFLIAVLVPLVVLYIKGEQGKWTAGGTFWSLAAGAAGAVGALGIVMAFGYQGRPVYVMPLVFGGAPVMNSFLTIVMSRTYKQVGPIFIAGLILVVAGAATVLMFRPDAGQSNLSTLSTMDILKILGSVLTVVICWGSYGPVLHKGQMKMHGSRLRPLMCVGISYFVIAVVVPFFMLSTMTEDPGKWTFGGSMWSLAAGSAGALGALGIIMAFATGGKPVFVMPLVFGGAPVVNTFSTMFSGAVQTPSPLFYAGLIIVVAGAAVVLIFAPKGHAPVPAPAPAKA